MGVSRLPGMPGMPAHAARVLVTGGAGFIGSHLVDALLARDPGARVTVLDKLTYAGDRANLAEHDVDGRLSFVQGDICDDEVVGRLVADADAVIHAAAETHVDRSISGPREFVITNVLGTEVMLEACRKHATPMLMISTDEVYGEGAKDGSLFGEESPLLPRSPYAASKAGADLACRAAFVTFGQKVTIVRGTNAYGPRQFPEKAIPVYTAAALDERPLPVYGDGSNRREWLYVTDWAAAALIVLDHGVAGEVYNIGAGFELANLELAERICALTGASWDLINFVQDRQGHDFRYGVASDKLQALGWSPQVNFEEGLAETVAWYRARHDAKNKGNDNDLAKHAAKKPSGTDA